MSWTDETVAQIDSHLATLNDEIERLEEARLALTRRRLRFPWSTPAPEPEREEIS